MTAVAAPYDELLTEPPDLSDGLGALPDDAVVEVLRSRFRWFLTRGFDASAALLLAVGVPEEDAAFAAGVFAAPALLH